MKANQMGRIAKLFICLSLLFYGLNLLAEEHNPKYRVGVILPLSGQVASLGQYVKRGIDLAYDALPADKKDAIELIYEDDQFNPTQTISAYHKLTNSHPLGAVFVVGSPPGNGVGPLTEHDHVILMAIGASDPSIAVGKEYSFIHWVTPAVMAKSMVAEIKRRDFKRIGFVINQASGLVADANALTEEFKVNGLADRVVYHQEFLKEDTDFRSALIQLRQNQVDVVVAMLLPGAVSSFAKQYATSGLKAELTGMETFEDDGEVKAANGALLGAWYVNASDSSQSFIRDYKGRYKENPGWGCANGFDTLNLIADAVSKVGPDSQKVKDYLRSVKDYDGATGKFSASGDNRFTLPAALKRITASGFETITVSK